MKQHILTAQLLYMIQTIYIHCNIVKIHLHIQLYIYLYGPNRVMLFRYTYAHFYWPQDWFMVDQHGNYHFMYCLLHATSSFFKKKLLLYAQYFLICLQAALQIDKIHIFLLVERTIRNLLLILHKGRIRNLLLIL